MTLTASQRATLDSLNDAQLRAITRENARKRSGGVPVPTHEQEEADRATFILQQRKAT